MSRWNLPAALVLAASLAAPQPASATIDPLAAVVAIDQARKTLRRVQRRWKWLRRKVSGKAPAPPPKVGPVMEKMRSPFPEERHQGVTEMLAVAERYRGRAKAIPQSARVEILLGQLLRDESWKTRYKAYQALTTAGFMKPVEDTSERFALLFPKQTPARQGLGARAASGTTGSVRGKSDVDLLHDFLVALKTRRPAVRTKLAAVLDSLVEAGLVTDAMPASAPIPQGPGLAPPALAPDSMPGASDLPSAGVLEQGLF